MEDDSNGWDVNRKLVMAELSRMSEGHAAILEAIGGLKEQVAALQVKAGLWGGLSGAAGAALTALVMYLVRAR